ncbi:hypothetical protein [Rhodococcus sp. X156]|uniref:hypothetical protein n=1 Tax=Rhodococcus sp. X156 TaxID=2499145 RepID=UPI000FDB2A60|nr:hypothetical protein [Rhodococcus sp. X156]
MTTGVGIDVAGLQGLAPLGGSARSGAEGLGQLQLTPGDAGTPDGEALVLAVQRFADRVSAAVRTTSVDLQRFSQLVGAAGATYAGVDQGLADQLGRMRGMTQR